LSRPATIEVVVRDGRRQEDIDRGVGEPWTLGEIAQSLGMLTENLMEMNDLESPQDIYPGLVLRAKPYTDTDTTWVSWYGEESIGMMASGEEFDPEDETICAHRWLPFGTRVRLTSLDTGKSIVVVVRDRGPYVDMELRHFDVSKAAAMRLGIHDIGVGQCWVEVLGLEED